MKPIDEQPPKPARRWLRFSLRSMLLLVLVIAIPLGWKVNRSRNQRIVVAELRKLNARIIYDYQIVNGIYVPNLPQPGPKWLTDLLGKEYFIEVYHVAVDGPQVNDKTIVLISKLPGVVSVALVGRTSGAGITDDGMAHLAEMANLENLALRSNRITGTGLMHLRWLRRLKTLVSSGRITDEALEQISKLEHLELLHLSQAAQVTDRGLAHIAKLTNLQSLRLEGGGQRDCMRITDEGLVNLYGLKNLGFLSLNSTEVTQAGIVSLKEALPKCKIEWSHKEPNDPR